MQYPIIDLIADAYINNGWTGLDISTGKNVLNPNYINEVSAYTTPESLYRYTEPITLKPNTTYTISGTPETQFDITFYYVLYMNLSNEPGTLVITNPSVRYPITAGNTTIITFTTRETGEIRFGITDNAVNFLRDFNMINSLNWQIEEGNTATPYEPYNPNPSNDFPNHMKLPLPHYFPHPVIDALQRAAAGTQTADDTEILRHYLTPLGIGGI